MPDFEGMVATVKIGMVPVDRAAGLFIELDQATEERLCKEAGALGLTLEEHIGSLLGELGFRLKDAAQEEAEAQPVPAFGGPDGRGDGPRLGFPTMPDGQTEC